MDEQGIAVTVRSNLDQLERVARTLALFPKHLPGAAEERDVAALGGRCECISVHVADHEDLPRMGVLYDTDHEAALIGLEAGPHSVGIERHAQRCTSARPAVALMAKVEAQDEKRRALGILKSRESRCKRWGFCSSGAVCRSQEQAGSGTTGASTGPGGR